jgi:hypothetical protein
MRSTWFLFSTLLGLLGACGGSPALIPIPDDQIQGDTLIGIPPSSLQVLPNGCEPEGPLGIELEPLLGASGQLTLRYRAAAKVDLLGLRVEVNLSPGQRLRVEPEPQQGALRRGEVYQGELGVDLGASAVEGSLLVRFIGTLVDPEGPGGQSQFQVERQIVPSSPGPVATEAQLVRLGDGYSLDVPAIHRPAVGQGGVR